MVNGEIQFSKPEACDPALYRYVRPMKPKEFGGQCGNFSSLAADVLLASDLSEAGDGQ